MDCVIGACLARRISNQNRFLCIEQYPIDSSEIHVPRANLNRRQAFAATEGPIPDAGDAIRYRNTRQVAAVTEGNSPDAGNAISNRDIAQATAATEGPIPDAGDANTNGDIAQATAATEGISINGGNRFTFDVFWNY